MQKKESATHFKSNYHATHLDQVPSDIPVTFTLAPHDPDVDEDGFKRYASRMNGLSGRILHHPHR